MMNNQTTKFTQTLEKFSTSKIFNLYCHQQCIYNGELRNTVKLLLVSSLPLFSETQLR